MGRQKRISAKELAEQMQLMGENLATLTERVAALEFGVKKLGGEEPPRAAATCGRCGRPAFWYVQTGQKPSRCPHCGNTPMEKKPPPPPLPPPSEDEDARYGD